MTLATETKEITLLAEEDNNEELENSEEDELGVNEEKEKNQGDEDIIEE